MRTPRALFLTVVVTLTAAAGVAAGPASAASAAVVTSFRIGGSGPGDLVQVTGSGFTPGTSVTVELLGTAGATPLTTAAADTAGAVALPAATRLPDTTAPGVYRLVLTQADGTSATSPAAVVRAPQVTWPAALQPGHPAYLLDAPTRIGLTGLANGPGVVRTVSIDGVPVTDSRWYADTNALLNPDLAIAVPADLPVGDHRVTFTQTGPTPYSVTGTVPVLAPVITVSRTAAPTGDVPLDVANPGWEELADLTVVGAAGDRHVGEQYVYTHPRPGYSTESGSFAVAGLSVGTATLTYVSRRNGATATTTFVVDGATVGSAGLAPGARVVSADGDTELTMQSDGNLVLVSYHRYPLWSSRTGGHPGARLAVQSDGNVVVVAPDGRPLWSTGTAGIGAGARFGLDAAGDAAVITASGRQAWSLFLRDPAHLTDLRAGRYLFRGQAVTANLARGPGGFLAFTMRADGNLAVSGTYQGTLWSTRTAGHPNAYVSLQSDGNLVLRAPSGQVLWANYAKATGARLVAQSDGNVVEYASNGRAVWSTRTAVR